MAKRTVVRRCVDCAREGITATRKAPNAGPRCATHHRARRLKTRSMSWEQRILQLYNLTAEEYWKIYAAQGGRCFICQRATGARKKLSVDHDHDTGEIRGLLCSTDNAKVLGHLRDSVEALQRAIDYLNDPPARKALGCQRFVPSSGAPVRGSTSHRGGARLITTDGGEQDE